MNNTETTATIGTPEDVPFGDTSLGEALGASAYIFAVLSGFALLVWALSKL
jgi:hypothetical protein